MNQLSLGSAGAQVQLLQLALRRAGFDPGALDGAFGPRTAAALRAFQRANGLAADGIAGARTHAALRPWYTGYAVRVVRPGDSFYRLARQWGSTIRAIETANPGVIPTALQPGQRLVIPLGFPVTPTEIDWCAALVSFCCEGLAARYPFITRGSIGQSVLGAPVELLRMGTGPFRVLWNAAHHANEWLTTPLLLRYAEALAAARALDESIGGQSARELLEGATLALIPCVNPDGMDLVTGALTAGPAYAAARRIAAAFPGIPFPEGWKANILGTDLNLQYPARWERAREIKYSQGFTRPAPRDYVGSEPLSAPESAALYRYTLSFSPALTLSYHTQGEVIYWKYLDYEPEGSRTRADRFAAASGYAVEETPYASGFAGYKDWYIQEFNRPGYTIEAGLGTNPLPLTEFQEIYGENLGILTESLVPFA